MIIYFAPMEGVTDGILRQVHNRIFGGIDVYCLPFHKLTQSLSLLTREERDAAPEENEGLKEKCYEYDLQIERLTRQAEHAYMRGKIDGLEFSIRCNGVSVLSYSIFSPL